MCLLVVLNGDWLNYLGKKIRKCREYKLIQNKILEYKEEISRLTDNNFQLEQKNIEIITEYDKYKQKTKRITSNELDFIKKEALKIKKQFKAENNQLQNEYEEKFKNIKEELEQQKKDNENLSSKIKTIFQKYEREKKNHIQTIKKYEKQIDMLNLNLYQYQEKIDIINREKEESIKNNIKLYNELNDIRGEVRQLQNQLLKEKDNSIIDLNKNNVIDKSNYFNNDTEDEFVQIAKQLKICVVGGSQSWQSKIISSYPFIKVIGSNNFSNDKLNNVDILIINTNNVSHAYTQKAYNIAQTQKAEIIYTSKNNIKQIKYDVTKRIQAILS